MEMAIVDRAELESLIEALTDIVQVYPQHIHTLRFAVEGGLKIKVNSGMWTAPYGRLADEGGY
jgi:hypothetical protein